jgi:hypothetical protein
MKTAIMTVITLAMAAGPLYGEVNEQFPPTPAQEQPDVLPRDPVHKAFAAPVDWQHSVGFSLYVAVCYFAIICGHAYVDKICYKMLKQRENFLVEEKLVTRTIKPSSTSENILGLRCAQSEFPSESPKILSPLLILPGLGVLVCIYLLQIWLPRGFYRGCLCLFIFAGSTILINALTRYRSALDFRATTTAMGISFFYGALFWWIDSSTPAAAFNSLLCAINASTNKLEGLKLLYDHTKNCIILVISLFVSICITLVWNICSTIEKQYNKVGLTQILTWWMVWLTFWFSLGLLGIIGFESGRRMVAILNSLT